MSERLLRHGASSQLNHPNLTDISQATDRPPTVLSPSLLFPFLCRLSPFAAAATRALSPYVDQPTTPVPACLPACGACFPIPHSTVVVVVARTLREKVTSRSRVSQDPANPSWYKIAPSGSHCQCLRCRRRCYHHSRRNASEREMSGNWDSAWIGTTRYRRLRGMLVVDGHCGALRRGVETFD